MLIQNLQPTNLIQQSYNSLTPILISRFLLNLRQLGTSEVEDSEHSGHRDSPSQHMSTVNFRLPDSIVGNMGEPLEHGVDIEEGEDDSALSPRSAVASCSSVSNNNATSEVKGETKEMELREIEHCNV